VVVDKAKQRVEPRPKLDFIEPESPNQGLEAGAVQPRERIVLQLLIRWVGKIMLLNARSL
jgi:hypothetical protein